MCGILFTNKQIIDLQNIIYYLQKRGPDHTSRFNYDGFEFIHTLLSMTGMITPQPFINKEKNIIAMFNGEIYNHREFDDIKTECSGSAFSSFNTVDKNSFLKSCSDGECIIPCYLKYGEDFVKKIRWRVCYFIM